MRPFFRAHLQPALGLLHRDAGRVEPFGEGRDEVDPAAEAFDLAPGDGGGEHVGAELDPVGDDLMRRAVEVGHALDGEGRGALALDPRAHRAQAAGEVDDLGLARGVADLGRALRQRRGHERVLGRAHGDEGNSMTAPFSPPFAPGVDVALAQVERRAQRLERLEVQVHGPRADGAAAGQRDDRLPVARQQRPEDEDRGAHLAHDVVVGPLRGQVVGRQRQHPPALQRLHLGPQRLQERVIVRMSDSRGALVSVSGPSVSSVAGISVRQAFLAPAMGISPRSSAPPLTRMESMFLPHALPGFDRAFACAFRRWRFALRAALSRSSRLSCGFGGAVFPASFSMSAFLADRARGVQIALASCEVCGYPAPRRAAVAQW
jgi:hypothetical protein